MRRWLLLFVVVSTLAAVALCLPSKPAPVVSPVPTPTSVAASKAHPDSLQPSAESVQPLRPLRRNLATRERAQTEPEKPAPEPAPEPDQKPEPAPAPEPTPEPDQKPEPPPDKSDTAPQKSDSAPQKSSDDKTATSKEKDSSDGKSEDAPFLPLGISAWDTLEKRQKILLICVLATVLLALLVYLFHRWQTAKKIAEAKARLQKLYDVTSVRGADVVSVKFGERTTDKDLCLALLRSDAPDWFESVFPKLIAADKLEELDLVDCEKVSSDTYILALHQCTNLKLMRVRASTYLEACPKLGSFQLKIDNGCPKVDVVQKRPRDLLDCAVDLLAQGAKVATTSAIVAAQGATAVAAKQVVTTADTVDRTLQVGSAVATVVANTGSRLAPDQHATTAADGARTVQSMGQAVSNASRNITTGLKSATEAVAAAAHSQLDNARLSAPSSIDQTADALKRALDGVRPALAPSPEVLPGSGTVSSAPEGKK